MAVDVHSPIAGTISKILVSEGERVSIAQPLIVLESMKMQVPVESPTAGTVARVSVKEGQPVEGGELLVTVG